MLLCQLDIHVQKTAILDTGLVPFTTIVSKWITDLNIKQKTKATLEDNIFKKNFDDLVYSCDFHVKHMTYQGNNW